jgi:MoxR-like ATPase
MGGQVWNRAPGVLIFGADNTMTTGDQSGRYSGTREMNSALADRFAWVVPFKFLEADVETAALVGMTGCKTALAREVVRILNVCRAKVSTGEIIDAPSIRAAAPWSRSI